MCMGGGAPKIPQTVAPPPVPAPPPAPEAPPKPPKVDAELKSEKATAAQKRSGTSALRIDLNLGGGGSPGLNVPA